MAVPTDHLDPEQVRRLAARIEEDHGRLDILVNNTWGGEHLIPFGRALWDTPLDEGLRMLDLGVRSHLITASLLLPLVIRHPGGLHVEVTDGSAETNRRFRENVFFDLAKYAPIRMALGLARDLEPHGSTAVCVTPGFLRSEQMLDGFGVTEENWRDALTEQPHFAIAESPAYVARGVTALAADPDRARWNGQSVTSGTLAKEYGFTDTDGSSPDGWRYFEEVVFGGKEADPESYR
ncbi:SDR family oxidoreductase [Actinomadura keratinilytica]